MFIPDNIKSTEPEETKNSIAMGSSISFPEFLANHGLHQLSAYAAISLYEQAMPFFDAVDLRATAFSEIPIKLYNKKTKEIITDHPVLDLLAAPNADMSQLEFLHALSSYYDITGEAFLVATGRASEPPREIMNVSPVNIGFTRANTRFGLLNIPESIYIDTQTNSARNYKSIDERGRLRFLNGKQDSELWHLRGFNPRRNSGSFRGLSKAKPVWMELQQYISGNTTNLSLLKRGTRLSMAWVNKSEHELTPVQWERMQQEAQKYSGEHNAGGTPILDGMDVKTIQQTNRDMEFGKLKDSMLSRVANIYKIPLSLLLAETMTLSNLETAILHLYDLAVLPNTKRLYSELGRFLLPRYKDGADLEFVFREADIPAVRIRLIDTAKRQKEIGVNTINELRREIGDEDVGPEGDVILVNSTQKTLEQVLEGPQIPEPLDTTPPPKEKEKTEFQEFSELMVKVKNEKGERKYDDMQIIEMAMEEGILNAD